LTSLKIVSTKEVQIPGGNNNYGKKAFHKLLLLITVKKGILYNAVFL